MDGDGGGGEPCSSGVGVGEPVHAAGGSGMIGAEAEALVDAPGGRIALGGEREDDEAVGAAVVHLVLHEGGVGAAAAVGGGGEDVTEQADPAARSGNAGDHNERDKRAVRAAEGADVEARFEGVKLPLEGGGDVGAP